MEWDRLSKELSTRNWIILLLLGSASFFFMSQAFTLGIILGGLLIIANFYCLQRTIRSAFGPTGISGGQKVTIIAKYYFRLAIMGIIIYILIGNSWADPIGLVIGLSIIVMSIVLFGIRNAKKFSSGEAI